MANTLAGFGFRGGQRGDGASSSFATAIYQIAYNDTIDLGLGDPVLQLSSGYIAGTATTFSTGGMLGIFCGCEYVDTTVPGGIRYSQTWPGVALGSSATVVTAKVAIDRSATYLAQYSGTTALTVDNIGNNIDIVSGTGSAPNAAGISTCVLDATSSLSTTALPFRIVGILGVGVYANVPPPIAGGDVTAGNGWVYVQINNSQLYSSTTGV